jgi:hypothetical protein
LRERGWFREVSLYGALIHVVVEDAASYKKKIRELLGAKEIVVRSMHVIAPSLEDVFIASVTQKQEVNHE